MSLKKFRKSVTSLTLGALLITNLGVSGFVKASGNDEKLPEMKEKVENLTTVTVSGENNTGFGEITEVAEIEEEKDSITTENTEESEIIEIEEVIEDNDNSEEETPIDSRSIPSERGKLDRHCQGVVSGYLDAATLIKMKQVNKKTADGTKCSGFITNYIEHFYNKFTETKTYAELTPDYAGNCLYSLSPGDKCGYLCDSSESALALQKLFRTNVRLVPLTQNFINDEEITTGLELDFNRITRKQHHTLYLFLPKYYKVGREDPEKYNQIAEDLFKLEMRLLNKDYIRSLSSQRNYIPSVDEFALFKEKSPTGMIYCNVPTLPTSASEMRGKVYAYNVLKKECLLHRHSSLRILPGKSAAEKEQYFEERVLPIVGDEQNQPKPGLPEELLARIRKRAGVSDLEFNKIYQMVQENIPGPRDNHQCFDYEKISQMTPYYPANPRRKIGYVRCFENPNKKSTITLDGKEVQLTYEELRSMQLFQEMPVWRMFGINTHTAKMYLEAELGRDARNLSEIWALSLVKPQRFKQILIDLSKYGTMERADIANLHNILRTIANNPGDQLRYQFRQNLGEETLQNVITLLRFLQTPYEYNELFLSRAIVQLLLQSEYWMGSTTEPEERVLELFLQHGLARNGSATVNNLITAIRKRPNPTDRYFSNEYLKYKSYLKSVFPDAFTETLQF